MPRGLSGIKVEVYTNGWPADDACCKARRPW